MFANIKNALKATESFGNYVPAVRTIKIEQCFKNSADAHLNTFFPQEFHLSTINMPDIHSD